MMATVIAVYLGNNYSPVASFISSINGKPSNSQLTSSNILASNTLAVNTITSNTEL